MNSKIMATVDYGKARIFQSWDFLQVGQAAYVVLHEANDGKIVIPIAANQIKDMGADVDPRKWATANLNASDAVNLNPAPEKSN
jgi:hypothetical protein